MSVGNLFAFRASDVTRLKSVKDPVGPQNDRALDRILRDADIHIVAWGTASKLPASLRGRWKNVLELANRRGVTLYCFGTTKDGHPAHPLLLPYSLKLTPWLGLA